MIVQAMSAEAWAAVSAISVAIITGVVTLQTRKIDTRVTKVKKAVDAKVDAGVATVEAKLDADVKPVAVTADRALTQIEALLPVIERLQRQSRRRDKRDAELRAMLAAHGQWDLLVLAEVRRSYVDFPEPPPLHRLDHFETQPGDDDDDADD